MMAKAKKQILVMTDGFVLIGEVSSGADKTLYLVEDASVIRLWGTTKGLGQIALEGPTSETILDPCGTVHVEKDAVLMRMDCRA